MGLLDATNAFVTCTTLELSMQSLNKYIFSFFQRSHEHHRNCLEFPDRNALCSILPFPYALVLLLPRVPWVPPNVQRSTRAHVCCVCVRIPTVSHISPTKMLDSTPT
jgi:hypothetical protein